MTHAFFYGPGSHLTPYQTAVMADGPVAYWPMNDSAPTSGFGSLVDITANPTNAGVTGANVLFRQTGTYLPLPTGLPVGWPGNQYAQVSQSTVIPKFVFSPTDTITVEAWVSITPNSDTGLHGGDVFSMNTNQGFRLGTDSGGSSGTPAIYVVYNGAVPYSVNVPLYSYLHVVVTAGPGGSSCYINGVLAAFSPNAWVGTDGTFVSIAGQYNTAFSEYLTGALSNVAVYNYPLTLAQVQHHFQVGGGYNYNQLMLADGAVASYPMGYSSYSGTTMTDLVRTWQTSGQSALSGTNGTFNEPFTIVGKSATFTQEPFYGALSGSVGLPGAYNGYGEAGFSTNFNLQTYSFECWLATPFTGMISSFSNQQDPTSGPQYDRCSFIGTTGQFGWGNFTAAGASVVYGGPAVNDGGKHHCVYTQSQNTDGTVNMTVYVDGAQVAQQLNQPPSEPYSTGSNYYLSIGYGREGGNSSWSSITNVSPYYHGSLSNVSLFLECLTPGQVLNHYNAGRASATPGGQHVLNLQFNGNFNDGAGHAVTLTGSPTTNTVGPPGGLQTSGVFSNNNFASYAAGPDFLLGSAFTIDCWCYFTSLPTSSEFATFFYQGTNTTSSQPKGLHIYLDGGLYNPAGHLVASNLTANYLSYNWQPSLNTWYHIQLQRSGTVLGLFINGVCVDANDSTTDTLVLDNCWVGGHPAYPAVGALTGYLNNFNITNTV